MNINSACSRKLYLNTSGGHASTVEIKQAQLISWHMTSNRDVLNSTLYFNTTQDMPNHLAKFLVITRLVSHKPSIQVRIIAC